MAYETRITRLIRTYARIVSSPLWTDRDDDRAKAFKYDEIPALTADEIAETIVRLVEDSKYTGGSVVMKTTEEEKIVFAGVSDISNKPGPVPSADLTHIEAVLERERGVPWKG